MCVLGLLCLHGAVFGQDAAAAPPPGILMFCDNPSVEKAVTSALHKFNEGVTSGHKLALFQILTASKSESGSDSIYSLQFTSRRSDCAAGSTKPWTECGYLPRARKASISCNATVHMTETETDPRQVDCVLDDYVVPERAPCLGCPEDIDVDSEDLKVPLTVSVSKYNSISNSAHLFDLHTIGVATRQVVAGFRFKLSFDMKKTICAKDEHKDLNELCVPDEENMEFSNCNSTVDLAPWRLEPPRAHIECEPGLLRTRMVRRRPPGWSPLRNLLLDLPSPAATAAAVPVAAEVPAAAATEAAVKESSEEEDTTAAKPSNLPDVAADPANDSPFHCPSKPWRALDAAAAEPTAEAATSDPSGTFSDKDLLG